jgi:excisionase family DNA binding protein
MEPMLTVLQAADLLRTSERFVRRLIAERRIEFVRFGRHVRIRESALIAFVVAGTTFASLRWGEITALTRSDIDLDGGTVRVRAAFVERSSGQIILGPPSPRREACGRHSSGSHSGASRTPTGLREART